MATSRTSVDATKSKALAEFRKYRELGYSWDSAVRQAAVKTGNAVVAVDEWAEAAEGKQRS